MNGDPGGAAIDVAAFAYELYQAGGSREPYSEDAWRQTALRLAGPTHPLVLMQGERQFLILVRHAKRDWSEVAAEKDQPMDGWRRDQRIGTERKPDQNESAKSGWKKTLDIATALAERLAQENVRVVQILYSKHKVAAQTAKVYAAVLCRQHDLSLEQCDFLTPESSRTLNRTEIANELEKLWSRKQLQKTGDRSREGTAIILVGHQPGLTLIADVALRGTKRVRWLFLRFMAIPVGGSEAACIALAHDNARPRLRWLLTEKPKPLTGELKDKLKSKVEIAKFFLGALAVNAAILVNTNLWSTPGAGCLTITGAFLIFVGLLFAVATLFGYDTLNMPTEFWGEPARFDDVKPLPLAWVNPRPRTVLRPPSEATVLLYYEMVNVWNRFFLPALCFTITGISFFLLTLVLPRVSAPKAGAPQKPPAAEQTQTLPAISWEIWAIAIAILLVAAGVCTWFYWKRGPELGVQD